MHLFPLRAWAFRRIQIADMVGFDVGTARNLHSAFLRDGEAALKLSGKGGRYHAYLTEEGRSIVA